MMSVEDNEKLTRTDRNTYMGEYLRSFWIPAMVAAERALGLAPDPVRRLAATVETHGGALAVSARASGGLLVVVTLPLAG